MKAADLRGVSRRKAPRTTQRQAGATPAPDLVQRNFTASRPNELWVADITYIPTCPGFLDPVVVLDAWSRRIVGWSPTTTCARSWSCRLCKHLHCVPARVWLSGNAAPRTSSTIPTMVASTPPLPLVAVALKLASAPRWARSVIALTMPCVEASSPPSNANCSTAPASAPRLKACPTVFQFIEGWYNPHRRHSAIDYLSPNRYEALHARTPQPATFHVSTETG